MRGPQYFWAFFLVALLWTFGALAWRLYRRRKTGLVFPPSSVRYVFHENMASGNSHKNWWTGLAAPATACVSP